MMEPLEIVLAVIGIAGALGGLIYHFKVMRDFKSEVSRELKDVKGLGYHNQQNLDWLKAMHDQRDPNGVPLWYVPRDWGVTQEQIVETQREIAHTLKAVASTLERIERRSEKE